MNKFITQAFLIMACLSITGCMTAPPKPTDIKAANFGPKASRSDMEYAARTYMSQVLFDPASATYRCSQPQKSWIIAGPGTGGNVVFGQTYYGYYSMCLINAKNRFGGYTGEKEYVFMICQRNGSPVLAYFDGYSAMDFVPE